MPTKGLPARSRLNRKRALLLAGLTLAVIALSVYVVLEPGVPIAEQAATPDGDPGYEAWKLQHPEATVICWGQGDLNADGQSETVLIYAVPAGEYGNEEPRNKEVKPDSGVDAKRWMTVIMAQGGGYIYTDPERAPVSNQKIEFRDIDEKAPTELIISGSKGTDVGYAVYRLTGDDLKNLFGEGMDKCC